MRKDTINILNKLNESEYDGISKLTQAPIYCYRSGELNTDRGLISFTTRSKTANYYSKMNNSEVKSYLVKINNPIIVEGSSSLTSIIQSIKALSIIKNINSDDARNELFNVLSKTKNKSISDIEKTVGTNWGQLTYDDFKIIDRYIADCMYKTNYDSIVYGDVTSNSTNEIQVLDKYINNIKELTNSIDINNVICTLILDKPRSKVFYSRLDKALSNTNTTYKQIDDTTIEFYGDVNFLMDFIGYKFVSPDGGMPKKIKLQILDVLSSGNIFEPQKYKPSMKYLIGWRLN